MSDETPEAPAEDPQTENTVLTADDVNVAEHVGAIQGSDKGTDPGRLSIEIGLYDPAAEEGSEESKRYANVEVPEGIHSLSEFALAFGLNAPELLGANGDDNIKAGETIRVPKTVKPFSHDVSVDSGADFNESGATRSEIADLHDERDGVDDSPDKGDDLAV